MTTIILLTKNSEKYLKRALDFYKTLNFNGKILVADSSCVESKKEIQNIINLSKNGSFNPFFIDYSFETTFSEKIASVIKYVDTKYTLLASVDDFFSVETIKKAEIFLDQNPSYVFVHGYTYGYTFFNNKINWYYTAIYHSTKSVDNNDVFLRIDAFLTKSMTSILSVFRTDILVSMLDDVAFYGSDKYGKFYENLFTIFALFKGKSKYLNLPFGWREMSNESGGKKYHTTWLFDSEFESNKKIMQKGIKKYIENIDQETINSDIHAEFVVNRFIQRCYKEVIFFENDSKINKIIIKKIFPIIIFNKIKELKKRVICFYRNLIMGKFLFNKKTPYYNEFKLIEHLIIESNIVCYRDGMEDIWFFKKEVNYEKL